MGGISQRFIYHLRAGNWCHFPVGIERVGIWANPLKVICMGKGFFSAEGDIGSKSQETGCTKKR